MAERYSGFQDLPIEVADGLKRKILEGESSCMPRIPKDTSVQEAIQIVRDNGKNPDYTKEELEKIVDAFNLFNNAVGKGLPNQLYKMLIKTLDINLAKKAYIASVMWFAGGNPSAREDVQAFADMLKSEIDKIVNWTEEQFREEYFLTGK